ncbi:MAG: D-glycero-beta-D-manno-heptose 1-phosphate adenylyltransferase [Candidatus Sumerlaeia bacterium]|nr:D-glycero-beta-D-manno-heptose 1-phosphate adenylyltransferase [Candidatus Sumerlaeia bacterium]
MNTSECILPNREAAARWAAELRAAGKKVVFTNGVFDMLHNGHLDSLRRAAAEGDVLIVGVNSDACVKRLKGPGRPILAEDQRLKVLSAIHCVDAVVLFDEDTPKEIIEAVAPDVLVKGGHYTIPEIVGHEFVLDRGGKVLSLPLLSGHSTSNLVDVIRERFCSEG